MGKRKLLEQGYHWIHESELEQLYQHKFDEYFKAALTGVVVAANRMSEPSLIVDAAHRIATAALQRQPDVVVTTFNGDQLKVGDQNEH